MQSLKRCLLPLHPALCLLYSVTPMSLFCLDSGTRPALSCLLNPSFPTAEHNHPSACREEQGRCTRILFSEKKRGSALNEKTEVERPTPRAILITSTLTCGGYYSRTLHNITSTLSSHPPSRPVSQAVFFFLTFLLFCFVRA